MGERLLQRVHISWLLAAIATGILPGAYAAGQWNPLLTIQEWYVVALILTGLVLIVRRRWVVVVALVAGCCLGMARGLTLEYRSIMYQANIGTVVRVTGEVRSDASIGTRGDERYEVAVRTLNDVPGAGTVWVSFGDRQLLKRGDIVVIEGSLSDGFGTYVSSIYRARLVNYDTAQNGDAARAVRDWFAAAIRSVLPADQAGLALGFLVGQKQSLSESLATQFQIVGLTHAVVASGFHLTVLVMAVRRLIESVSKYLTLVVALSMIGGFTAVTGLSPSMSRAAIIASLALWAWYYGRAFHPGVLLLVVAGISALWNPLYVRGDIGWYLSFAAFVGVIMLAPLLHAYFWGEKPPGVVRTLILGTLAAQITTLPLLLFVFGAYSPYALFANMLIVPLVTLAMAGTLLIGILALIALPVGTIAAIPLSWLLQYMISVVSWIATLPSAQQEFTMSFWQMITCYGLLVIGMWYMHMRSGHSFTKQWQII